MDLSSNSLLEQPLVSCSPYIQLAVANPSPLILPHALLHALQSPWYVWLALLQAVLGQVMKYLLLYSFNMTRLYSQQKTITGRMSLAVSSGLTIIISLYFLTLLIVILPPIQHIENRRLLPRKCHLQRLCPV